MQPLLHGTSRMIAMQHVCWLGNRQSKEKERNSFSVSLVQEESKYQVHIKSHQCNKFQCSHCYKEFKREDHAKTHEANYGDQLPTFASVPQYRQAGPSSLSTAAQPDSQLNATQMMLDPQEEA